jgi:hypothetical protein
MEFSIIIISVIDSTNTTLRQVLPETIQALQHHVTLFSGSRQNSVSHWYMASNAQFIFITQYVAVFQTGKEMAILR